MTSFKVLRLQGKFIALQLLLLVLLLLPYLNASPCSTAVKEMVVTNTSGTEELREALLCDGGGRFEVSWHGNVMLSRTLSVSNGSILNVVGSSDSKDDTDTGAVVISDGTVLLFEVDLASTVSLTGLTLSGGDGALSVTGTSFVELTDCIITDNYRTSSEIGDGAVYVSGSKIVLKGETVFANNTADYYGGAISLWESSELDCTEGGSVSFVNNHAAFYGGAVYVSSSNVVLKGETVFAKNTADVYGGAISLHSSELNCTEGGNVSFVDNLAAFYGGGAVYVPGSNIVLKGETVFANNTADYYGGAISLHSSELHCTEGGNVSFVNNHATLYGGSISLWDSSELIFKEGGSVSFANNNAGGYGGAICSFDSSELIFKKGGSASFVNNHATLFGGKYYHPRPR